MSELIGTPRDAVIVKSDFVGGRIEPLGEGAMVSLDEVSEYPGVDDVLDDAEIAGQAGQAGQAAAPDEDESVDVTEGVLSDALDAEIDGHDVVWDLAIAAAATGKGFDGPFLADLLRKSGAITDVRLLISIEVLSLGSKLTGDKMLSVLGRLGFELEAAGARAARDALGSVPNVAVEAVTAMPIVETEGGAS